MKVVTMQVLPKITLQIQSGSKFNTVKYRDAVRENAMKKLDFITAYNKVAELKDLDFISLDFIMH